MSRLGHISLGISLLCLLVAFGARYIIGGWINFLFVPLISFVVLFILGLIINYKYYIEFLTLKTTKNSLNMGTLIVLGAFTFGIVNYLGIRTNVNFDLSSEKLYTLAEQSSEAAKSLTEEFKVLVFHRGEPDAVLRRRARELLDLYKNASNNITVQFINALDEPLRAKRYISKQDYENRGLYIYVDYGGKTFKVDHPQKEEQFTQVIIKSTRSKNHKIYFLRDHGEGDIKSEDSNESGLSRLKKTLEDYSFEVEELSLNKTIAVPKDAKALAIVGAKFQFSSKEFNKIESYLNKGGRLLVALDPGQRTDLPNFLKKYNIDFKDNYVLDPNSSVGQAVVIATLYSKKSRITKKFGDRTTIFNLVSEVQVLDSSKSLESDSFVFSGTGSVIINDVKPTSNAADQNSYPLAVAVRSKVEPAAYSIAVFGDSDFLTNQFVFALSNRDLIVNTIAYLTEQNDLIAIRPKIPESSTIVLTRSRSLGVVFGAIIIPLLLFMAAFMLWFSNRGN